MLTDFRLFRQIRVVWLLDLKYYLFMNDYKKIEMAIGFIVERNHDSWNLSDLGKFMDLSPGYLQKLFTKCVGVSPKQFSRYLKVEYAKKVMSASNNLLELANKSKLSSPGR